MNNRSATGQRRLDFDDFLDNSEDGDWYIRPDDPRGVWLNVPGVGCTYFTTTEPQAWNGAKWSWNGDYDKPTLTPSLNIIGQWHGWLREGQLISC